MYVNIFLLFLVAVLAFGIMRMVQKKYDEFMISFLISNLAYGVYFYITDFQMTNVGLDKNGLAVTFLLFYAFIVPAATLVICAIYTFIKSKLKPKRSVRREEA